MSKPKFGRNYARRKLELVLRDLRDYTADEFWREISRIASGATGLPSVEHLKGHAEELEAELAAARAGWQETIAKMASQERPAYDEQQQRIAKLEAINLGLTKTLVEMEEEKAKLVGVLEPFAACADELDGYPADGVEPSDDNEWASFRLLVSDYRRARTALASCRKQGAE